MTDRPEPVSATDTADREIIISRIFKAPRALVFDALIDPQHIGSWWGPTGFTTTTSVMDVRSGGQWIFVMHGPDGVDFPNWIRYQEVVRPQRLVYEQGGETPDAAVHFHVTVTLVDHPDGTELTMRSLFPTTEARDHVVRNYGAIEGGKQHLARLAGHLAAMESSIAERELATTRRIRASRATVWSALTDAQVLATWWGPDGFTNTFTLCDLRPGGEWTFTMHGPNGVSYPNQNRFVELHAPERWVIEHTSHPKFRLSLTLTAHGAETEVHWCQTFAKAEDCAALRAICVPANEQNLDRLAAAVAKLG